MGRELRSIVLSPAEFESAVGDYYEQTKGVAIHASNIRSLKLGEGDDIDCRIDLVNALLDGKTEIVLNTEEIIDVIMRYVQGKGHPLPKRGKKTLNWLNGELAVMIELDWF